MCTERPGRECHSPGSEEVQEPQAILTEHAVQNGGMGVCDCLTSQHGLRIVAQLFAYPEPDGV